MCLQKFEITKHYFHEIMIQPVRRGYISIHDIELMNILSQEGHTLCGCTNTIILKSDVLKGEM
jgi:hypothetical protein